MVKKIKATGTPNPAGALPKCQTGISGLDEVTGGGLPRGRSTLVCGEAGCGKTLLAMEFLYRGATQFDEPGVFVSFEEKPEELTQNVRSLGFDLDSLIAHKKLAFEYVYVERSEIEETGEYDLEALFIRLNAAIDSVGAKRVALDTIESLFGGLANEGILRAELRRLFRWLKEKGVTVVITAERGEKSLTRHGIEEYVSDCVMMLDLRIIEQVATRRLRVVKYRGSKHESNEYPFLIDELGFSVLPLSSLKLNYGVTTERISTGVPRLDVMLGGQGYFRGASVLVTGSAGTGKSTLAAAFADATCRRGEQCLIFAFEESPQQIVRNMRSVGIDLERWVEQGLLRFIASRPTLYGLEMHLVTMLKAIEQIDPNVFILDPITSFLHIGAEREVSGMLMRLIGFAKSRGVSSLFTSLISGSKDQENSQVGISSLMDTWLHVRDVETNGERTRGLYVLKSRGMAHSNQVREFVLSDRGLELVDVYIGSGEVLTGTARVAQEAKDRVEALARQQEVERLQRELEEKRQETELQISLLRSGLAAREHELLRRINESGLQQGELERGRRALTALRSGDDPSETANGERGSK